MGSVRTKKIDRNRFKKVYPRFRNLPNIVLQTNGEVRVEAMEIDFNNQDSATIILSERYTSLPSIVVSSKGSGSTANVNVFVSSASLGSVPSGGGFPVTVTVSASDNFTGQVALQAIQI